MNNFYQGIALDLSLEDRRFLTYLAITYLTRTEDISSNNNTFDQYRHFFLKNSKNSYIDRPIFQKIADLFQKDSKYNQLEHIYKYSQVSCVPNKLIPHVDFRKCVISIPLVPLGPVSWFESDSSERFLTDPTTYKPIMTYDYRHETSLINTHIFHGSPDNDQIRIFFQIGGFAQTLQEVVGQIKPMYLIIS